MTGQNRQQALSSEREIAGLTGMKKTAGSGCGIIQKGDVGDRYWHIEDKSTRKPSMRFMRSWLTKAREQAQSTGKQYWAVSLTFTERYDRYHGPMRFFVLDETRLPLPSLFFPYTKSFSVTPSTLLNLAIMADPRVVWSTPSCDPLVLRIMDEAAFVCLLHTLRAKNDTQP